MMIKFPTYDKKRRHLIDFLLEQSMRSGLTNAGLITLTGFIVWGAYPAHVTISWLLIGYLISLPRHLLFSALKKTKPIHTAYLRIEIVLVLLLFLSGLFWGISGWLFFIPDDIAIFMFVALTIVGAVVSALPVFSALPYIWVIFAVTAFFLITVKLITIDFWSISLLPILSLIGLTPLSLNMGKQIERSITLYFKNAELLKEVHEAKEKAEKANLAKSQFMAATSHDLRQPLHAQGILLEALSLRLKNNEHLGLLEKIVQSNSVLSSLFNALLEISQLDAGTMPVNISHQPLRIICQQVVDEYQMVAQKKNLEINLFGDDAIVITDSVLFNRILRNLVNNALKFTSSGSITIKIDTSGNDVVVSVSDTGMGIPESQQKHIFDEYYQLDNKARDRNKGIGLGLALVRRMCELLQHNIQLESAPGQGTCFRLTLPRGESSKVVAKQDDITAPSVENLHILLIDDEEPILEAMTVMLKDWKCHPKAFPTLKQAEEYLNSSEYRPDIIISDYRLKEEVTGLDAIQRIQNKIGEKVPALIISGDTDPDLLESIKRQEFYMLHKPLKASQLKKVIRVLMAETIQ